MDHRKNEKPRDEDDRIPSIPMIRIEAPQDREENNNPNNDHQNNNNNNNTKDNNSNDIHHLSPSGSPPLDKVSHLSHYLSISLLNLMKLILIFDRLLSFIIIIIFDRI